jgi:glutaredoxin-like protein NrdH
MAITVYTKPACGSCMATKRALDKAGIDYVTVDITTDEAALARLKALGHMGAPVVETETDSWNGFNPVKMAELIAAHAELIAA